MAIKEYRYESKIKLELDGGTDGDKQITKSKTYGNIKPDTDSKNFIRLPALYLDFSLFPCLR